MSDLFGKYGTLLALILIVVAFAIASPGAFGTPGNLINITQQMSLLAIVAVGVTLVMAAGEFDLATASLVSFGGIFIMYLFAAGVPAPLAFVIVLAAAGCFGALSGFIIARFEVLSFIATLAAGTIIGGVTFYLSDGATLFGGIPDGFRDIARGWTFGLPTLTWWMIGVAIVVWLLLDKIEFGRRLYAIGGNREASRLAGVRIVPNTMMAFALSGMLAALVGMLLTGRIGSANPTGGGGYLLTAYAAVFLGMTAFRDGEANVPGTLVGAAIIAVVSNGLTILGVSTFLQDIITGSIILAAVLVRRIGKGA
ncbi:MULTISPECIES: ABC transporter permease [Devosia]|uniref:Ribose transport system permease protein RbsC n=1 Tax=Devosia equisanguinis TaxID=2490941 RepID=A0A447ID93_9HYPH|nr:MULTISPECIES: ABC transporter permease [Devosia]ODT50944.1 MAG: ABC transporter permease [Pelagibacterium sp. SCN 63-126]ODU85675.1 MAG: ABC transporter permease [Pelagibacterium sp. SCN 63-17]OJX44396.1 MAG: ABC transporter permease [Devosia sp. 63-57]VDS05441.1 Ribose transport system permease protein RbsC [Devosia equisanguinis]